MKKFRVYFTIGIKNKKQGLSNTVLYPIKQLKAKNVEEVNKKVLNLLEVVIKEIK